MLPCIHFRSETNNTFYKYSHNFEPILPFVNVVLPSEGKCRRSYHCVEMIQWLCCYPITVWKWSKGCVVIQSLCGNDSMFVCGYFFQKIFEWYLVKQELQDRLYRKNALERLINRNNNCVFFSLLKAKSNMLTPLSTASLNGYKYEL